MLQRCRSCSSRSRTWQSTFFTPDGTGPRPRRRRPDGQRGRDPRASSARAGRGKSVTALSISAAAAATGAGHRRRVLFREQDLADAADRRMRRIRGEEISMIFQNPRSSLNPVFRVGRRPARGAARPRRAARRRSGRPGNARCWPTSDCPTRPRSCGAIPHQLSGGHGAAGDDRARPGVVAQPADRGRADDGARRDHPACRSSSCSRACERNTAWRRSSSPTTSASSPSCATGSP